MLSIVISRVLRHRAFLIGISLLLILAFFQLNQAPAESATENNIERTIVSQSESPKTPSIPQTPETPDTPDLPEGAENSISKSRGGTTAVKVTIVSSGETTSASLDISPEPEEPENLEEQLEQGKVNVKVSGDNEENVEVDFNFRTRTKTKEKYSYEQEIEESRETRD